MEITYSSQGSFTKTMTFLDKLNHERYLEELDSLAKEGLEALMAATPKKTGLTADSWTYKIEKHNGMTTIGWYNSNKTSQGDIIAIMLQYGHGTGTGGYVQGRDYINPAIQPIFDKIEQKIWQRVQEE